ncbi:MAG: bifunctional D-glycero-beta-D-manno-heptose-7-phosphate kinase/D-glycero-beta-D-manno-heptose 1-phosphate adenylyltransferase HldE [Proteobacteria bacterium]|nr:MAG: bifunctional D-glycero-beta-D-manno-heptose-7-phosphate kinase/D-glycero-beta-D-manno-heptose 1-phosphate adenylyltransferase HldE [Pseudomonadota bacterium]QKK10238.1 MAG: bifunctional D-glycero-beta-D-manno-heptose-7-phosphate kinase/D-glycero-beta-D-manno-heptose 1-phosphate adenylyltransferase HldE [Pseudomonadota bacterium]
MKTNVPEFALSDVLIVGDMMLDRYWHGPTSRISPEAPVPVVQVRESEERPGGAGNVALNVAALGGRATVVGLVGGDEAGDRLGRLLGDMGVRCRLVVQDDKPTITKLRVISRHQQLIRVDFEDSFFGCDDSGVVDAFNVAVAATGAVIISDYGKGTLQHTQQLISTARAAGKPVLVDPKGSDFSHYRGATLITPNLAEFEAVVGVCTDQAEIVKKGLGLITQLGLDALLVTRGEQGMTLIKPDSEPLHLPTHAREVFDVTGAGDTVISVLAAALAAGQSLEQATALSNLAAGIVVAKLGTAAVSVPELQRALHQLDEVEQNIVSEGQLLELVGIARAHGERIVMTNGCFDILHAGHVAYLNQARRLGDRLIVAVNDDDSVRRLKGATRPVNHLQERMEVLAGLGSVDWVVPFTEDTPECLICAVMPDILVKGGDYRPEQIAGHDCVKANGGEVVVLAFRAGCSTTRIIETITKE